MATKKPEYLNKSKSLADRKTIFRRDVSERIFNPVPATKFNPETFDPMEDDTEEYRLQKRVRKAPEGRLNTYGMKPKEIIDCQMIGMYESKQDLYLLIAHVQHTLLDRIEDLENTIRELKKAKSSK